MSMRETVGEIDPNNDAGKIEDFTEDNYVKVLIQAKSNYEFVSFVEIDWSKKFILWRHDIDFSINRALSLAKIESKLGIVATYFVHLQSNFYNPFELSQTRILRQIVDLGHRVGLHFDASYHSVSHESQLDELIYSEAKIVNKYFGCAIDAFSFHNPLPLHLRWQRDTYADLVNCYSKTFAERVDYCSDSNGYWRYRNILDVVTEAKKSYLQVLTHPGHWQKTEMHPRERVFRCALGRLRNTMEQYDMALLSHGRSNHSKMPMELQKLISASYKRFIYIDFLWSASRYQALLLELIAELENSLNHSQIKDLERTAFYRVHPEVFEAKRILTSSFDLREQLESNLIFHCQKIATIVYSFFKQV